MGYFIECSRCGGSGFEGQGTDYGSVCSHCGGQKFMPSDKPQIAFEALRKIASNNALSKSGIRKNISRADCINIAREACEQINLGYGKATWQQEQEVP